MRILDIIENVITETDENILDQLVDLFKKTTGTFENASHKFYYVRKILSNRLEGDDHEAVKKVIPSEFFNYMKSKKTTPSPEPTPTPKPEPSESEVKQDLILPTDQDLKAAGTTSTLIKKWTRKYYKHYEPEEIMDMLYNSVVGDYEDTSYINREVRGAIISIKQAEEQNLKAEIMPLMQKKFTPSKEKLDSLRGSKIYDEAMKKIQHDIDNQPRVPGQKPQKPQHVAMYYKKQYEGRYENQAFNEYKDGNIKEAEKSFLKYLIIKNASEREILQWYWAHK